MSSASSSLHKTPYVGSLPEVSTYLLTSLRFSGKPIFKSCTFLPLVTTCDALHLRCIFAFGGDLELRQSGLNTPSVRQPCAPSRHQYPVNDLEHDPWSMSDDPSLGKVAQQKILKCASDAAIATGRTAQAAESV